MAVTGASKPISPTLKVRSTTGSSTRRSRAFRLPRERLSARVTTTWPVKPFPSLLKSTFPKAASVEVPLIFKTPVWVIAPAEAAPPAVTVRFPLRVVAANAMLSRSVTVSWVPSKTCSESKSFSS